MLPNTHKTPNTLAECRMRAYKLMPYLHQAIMSMTPVATPGLGTFAVDKYGRLYYDPEIVLQWPLDKSAAAILHEVMHIVLNCSGRSKALLGDHPKPEEFRLFNIAQDIYINDSLREVKFSGGKPALMMGDDWMYSDKFGFPKNLRSEEYYELLKKLPEPPCGRGGGSGEKDDSGPGGDNEKPDVAKGGCGGCSDGQHHQWEQGAPKDQGGNSDVHGMSEFERKMIERQVAENIERHQRSNGRGTVPGSLARMAQEILRPKTDPVRELLAKVKFAVNSTHGHGDYTWKKISRRNPNGAVRLPAHIRPVPRVTAIIDTSGSMGQEDLGLALGVIAQVLNALPSDGVRVVCGDACVQSVKKVFRPEQTELAGGGGTSMRRIMEDIAHDTPKPNVLLVVTDGETDWPPTPLDMRCVACVTRESSRACFQVPAWMDKVELQPA